MDSLKIFVGGLSQNTTRESLNAYFGQFGSADSYIMVDKGTGRSRGFGFVNFTDERVMQSVLAVAGHEVDSVPISVSAYQGSSGGGGGRPPSFGGHGGHGFQAAQGLEGASSAARDRMKVFVGGLSQDTTKETLNAYFQQFGYADSFIMLDKATGRSRGFGFVNFQDEMVMNMVLQAQHEVDGTPISVSAYTDKGGSPFAARGGPAAGFHQQSAGDQAQANALAHAQAAIANLTGVISTLAAAAAGGGGGGVPDQLTQLLATPQISNLLQKVQTQAGHILTPVEGGGYAPTGGRGHSGDKNLKLFVGGLSQSTTKESLNAYYSQFGHVDSLVMMDKGTGRSRGFGFVDFQDDAAMQTVLLYQHTVDGATVSLSPYGSKSGGGGGGGGAKGGARSSPY